jgi:prophage maintenance system killer protein
MRTGKEFLPLAIADLLLIAQRELKISAERLKDEIDLRRAIVALHAPFPAPGEIDLYPHPVEKSAICCARLVRAHLFEDGNKRIAFECMCEMLATAEHPWPWVPSEEEEIATEVDRLQAGTISEKEFVEWVWERLKA